MQISDERTDWNDAVIGRLRALWDEGLSAAEIGRRLGMSKNAVVGKKKRLGLPGRPSPIKPSVDRPHVRRPPVPTLAEIMPASILLPCTGIGAPVREPAAPLIRDFVASRPARLAVPVADLAADMAPDLAPVGPLRVRRGHDCAWPLGHPGTPSFRFCDAPAPAGKPYCTEHAKVAYVKVRDARVDRVDADGSGARRAAGI